MSIYNALELFFFFFFNDPAPTEIYTLSLHDALPICARREVDVHHFQVLNGRRRQAVGELHSPRQAGDRKSTRLNSSHSQISYAVFCLKKKKTNPKESTASATTASTFLCHPRGCWPSL